MTVTQTRAEKELLRANQQLHSVQQQRDTLESDLSEVKRELQRQRALAESQKVHLSKLKAEVSSVRTPHTASKAIASALNQFSFRVTDKSTHRPESSQNSSFHATSTDNNTRHATKDSSSHPSHANISSSADHNVINHLPSSVTEEEATRNQNNSAACIIS